MVNLTNLKTFIAERSTINDDHIVWNTLCAQSKKPHTIKVLLFADWLNLRYGKTYSAQELWFILQGKIKQDNTVLKQTCKMIGCIVHYEELQLNLKSVLQMNSYDYEYHCNRIQQKCNPQGPITKCIELNSFVSREGYAQFACFGSQRSAQCIVWELANMQDIPKDMVTRHLCHNKLCVNEDHLEIGTNFENANDQIVAGKSARGKQCHFRRDGENNYFDF